MEYSEQQIEIVLYIDVQQIHSKNLTSQIPKYNKFIGNKVHSNIRSNILVPICYNKLAPVDLKTKQITIISARWNLEKLKLC